MTISETVTGQIAEVVIDSPPVNAVSVGDLRDLAQVFRSYRGRPEIRAAVLSGGTGRGFNAGGNIKEILALTGEDGLFGQSHGTLEATLAIYHSAVPVIAAVHGYCIGNGMLLIGVCDIVVAARNTRFIFAEVDNGSVSGAIHGLALLPEKRLRAAMYTCEPVAPEELHAHGAIYQLVDAGALRSTALDLAGRIAAKDPKVIRRAKANINGAVGRDLESKYRQEMSYSYELKMIGAADSSRLDFVEGRRSGYETPGEAR
jgi:enoyl-CoA hydratase